MGGSILDLRLTTTHMMRAMFRRAEHPLTVYDVARELGWEVGGQKWPHKRRVLERFLRGLIKEGTIRELDEPWRHTMTNGEQVDPLPQYEWSE